jgi:hypothetical protein
MAYPIPLQEYKRATAPALLESQKYWLEEEFRKLERVLETITVALKDIDARLAVLEP